MATFQLVLAAFLLVLASYGLPVNSQPANISAANNKVVKILSKDKMGTGFWSFTTVRDRKLTDNKYGKLYIGDEAAIFRLLVPGLYNSSFETVSFQLFGHSRVFVRGDLGEVYLDRYEESVVFNMSACTFRILESHGDTFYLSSLFAHGLNVSLTSSLEVSMSSNASVFLLAIVPDNVESLEVNTGLTQRSWVTGMSDLDLNSSDVETLVSSPPNDTTTLANILPYTLDTRPNTVYQIQGYWRPYFDGLYSINAYCDFQYKVKVEVHDRTVRFCDREETCSRVMLFYGGSTHAYYYVELLIYSGNASGVFYIHVTNIDGIPLKFAEFTKVDNGKESHRWTFATPCFPSCWDELHVALLAYDPLTDSLNARYLTLNRENFMSSFSVGFWLSRSDLLVRNVSILSYGADLDIWYESRHTGFGYLHFNVRGESTFYVIPYSRQIVHVVFTWSNTRGSRCYINGELITRPAVTSVFGITRKFSVANPVNEHFNLTELVLWATEMTPEQVLEEYQVSCHVYPSTCRWKNGHRHPNQWLVGSGRTSSYPFTGPHDSSGYYFYIEGSAMDYNSSAIFLSPNIVSACLRFQYYMYGAGIGRLSVYAKYEGHLDILWSLVGARQRKFTSWRMASVSLSSLDKKAWKKIAFHAVRGESFRSDIAISDMRLQVEGCQTQPEGALPGTLDNGNSCPVPCPSGSPCIKETEICHCDTRQANFVNQFCRDDIEYSLYQNASYYFSMDKILSSKIGFNDAQLVTGVANKSIYIKKGGKIASSLPLMNNFSVSMWTKIAHGADNVFRFQRVFVRYLSESVLNIIVTPNLTSSTSFCLILRYMWPFNIFLHMGIVTLQNAPYVELYKNGILQTPYNFTPSFCKASTYPRRVVIFQGITYDDLAVWSRSLDKTEIGDIFLRYRQYEVMHGYYTLQPVIFNVEGLWTKSYAENITDKNGLVSEEVHHDIYNELVKLRIFAQDVTVTTNITMSPESRPARITIFLSGITWPTMGYWTRHFMKSLLIEKSKFADIVKDYTVTSKYVSDTAPYNLTVRDISATLFNLSWEFTFREKLSPFQGFIVFARSLGKYSFLATLYETTVCEVKVVGLAPFTSYEVNVMPRHLVGSGFISETIIVETGESVPSKAPRDFKVNAVSSTSLEIKWSTVRKNYKNGIITGYMISIIDTLVNENREEIIAIPLESTNVSLKEDLKKYHPYFVRIAATTSVGRGVWSNWMKKRTLKDVPSAAPQNFTGVSEDRQSITFSWHEVPSDDWNSPSIEYVLRCCNVSDITCINRTISAGHKNLTLTGLRPLVLYNCSLFAFNKQGEGPSVWLEVTTMVCRKSFQNVTITNVTAWSISLNLNNSPLCDQNSILYLEYHSLSCSACNCSTVQLDITNAISTTIYGLSPNQSYNIYLYEVSGASVENCVVTFEVKTAEYAPPPQNITVVSTSSTSLKITWFIDMLQDFRPVLNSYEIHLMDAIENTTLYLTEYNTTKLVFLKDGLKKYHSYFVRMAVRSEGGVSELSPWFGVKTLEDKPCSSPGRSGVWLSQTLKLFLVWSPLNSSEWCGEPRGYRISYGLRSNSTASYTTVNVSYDINKSWLRNLTRFELYDTYVAAFTTVGVGPSVWRKVYVNDVPTSAPAIHSVVTINSTSLAARWSGISQSNGKAKGYTIQVQCFGCSGIFAKPKQFKISPFRSYYAVLSGLNIYSNYSVQIAAYNLHGEGNFSDPVFAMTAQTAPKEAPRNVSSISTGPNNLTVFWSHLDNTWGEIVYYSAHLYTKLLGTMLEVRHQRTTQNCLTFTGLSESTEYKFDVYGATKIGEGPFSVKSIGRTLSGDAEFCPSNISLFNITSTSVEITWQTLNSNLVPGGLPSYEILYRVDHVGFPRETRVTNTRSTRTAFRLQRLEESVTYWIAVRAHVVGPTGNYGIPQCHEYNITTKDDAPDAPPLDINEASITSTSITVNWKPIPLTHMNGELLGYRLNYSMTARSSNSRTRRDTTSNGGNQITVGPGNHSYVIEDLRKFTTYSITIAGYNRFGEGPYSQNVNILTAEDVPSRAPTNLRTVNKTSSTSLLLSWDPVPQDYVHGILTGYTVRYQAIEQGAGVKLRSQFHTLNVPPRVNMVDIPHLASYTRYKFSMFAKTKVGGGIFSEPVVGETCRCHRSMSTNWWEIRPYIGSAEDSSVTGVFSVVLHNMITSCCQSCGAHRSTTVEFQTEGSPRKSLEDVRNAISESDLSFPVYGSSDQDQHGSLYGYVPVISSPGEAYVVNREPKHSSTEVLIATVVSCWPMVILILVFSILAGTVIWLLESRSNPEEFPQTFFLGIYQGIWWAFVTSSTVGYGDRRPKTFGGKLFAVVWTLTGQIVILLVTSIVTGHLTTYSMKIDRSLYGKQVAAILNSPQYNFAIRRNANVKQISYNVEDMISLLKERQVDGLVVDTYVAGARKELFSEYFRVRKVFDHKSAYGVVLAGDAMKLQTCFTKYIKENRGMIFDELHKVVAAIEEPKLSESLTRSTNLFDPTSGEARKSLVYCIAVLSVLVVVSLLYEGNRRRRKNKVEPYELNQARRKLNEDTRRELRQFASKVKCLCLRIRQKHKQELLTLNEMKKSLGKVNGSGTTGKNQGFLPSVE